MFMSVTAAAWSISRIRSPGIAASSAIAAVGSPPAKKNASIRPVFSASTAAVRPSRWRLMSAPSPERLDDAVCHQFGGASWPANRHPLAPEIGHADDPSALQGDHVHAIWIKHHEGAQVDPSGAELVLTARCIERRIDHGQRHLALPQSDHLEIVDRTAGDAGDRD
jgi:hypothetical protein